MDTPKKSASAAADLTDDLIVEILSRLPPKSICRFKCISWHWYGLITDPEHRKKIPQTLSGFFYPSYSVTDDQEDRIVMFPDFINMVGEELPLSDPSLVFMTGYRSIIPQMCCNGLLFCLCKKVSPRHEDDYVVCNPATEEWVVLPDSSDSSVALMHYFGFDPTISPHFHVFQITEAVEGSEYIGDVNIYSSETGLWSCKGNSWGNELQVADRASVFLNGMLHLPTWDCNMLAVDTEGKTWKNIPLLDPMTDPLAFIGQSEGRLYCINMMPSDASKLSVWILQDYDSGEWILKYNISTEHIFGEKNLTFEQDYTLIAIHPDCNLIFFVWRCDNMLMSYDMDRGKVCVICNIERYLLYRPYLPYVPFLKDLLACQG